MPTFAARVRLTSANSVNIGRLLPQMVYYFHAVAQLTAGSGDAGRRSCLDAERQLRQPDRRPDGEARRAADRAVRRRDQRQRRRACVSRNRPVRAAASVPTLANAMDVGNPSNFERMSWLYGGDLDAMRRDVAGCRHTDDEVRATIRRVYEERGYLLDPHSAIALSRASPEPGLAGRAGRGRRLFLATAHPAKFAEDRRADHRPPDREAAGIGGGARRRAPHHQGRCHAARAPRSDCCPRLMAYRYRHGRARCAGRARVQADSATPPEMVHEFVSDLYRYEIRRLRARLLAGEFPKTEYLGRVVQLRMRYPVISIRAGEWLEPQS